MQDICAKMAFLHLFTTKFRKKPIYIKRLLSREYTLVYLTWQVRYLNNIMRSLVIHVEYEGDDKQRRFCGLCNLFSNDCYLYNPHESPERAFYCLYFHLYSI